MGNNNTTPAPEGSTGMPASEVTVAIALERLKRSAMYFAETPEGPGQALELQRLKAAAHAYTNAQRAFEDTERLRKKQAAAAEFSASCVVKR